MFDEFDDLIAANAPIQLPWLRDPHGTLVGQPIRITHDKTIRGTRAEIAWAVTKQILRHGVEANAAYTIRTEVIDDTTCATWVQLLLITDPHLLAAAA